MDQLTPFILTGCRKMPLPTGRQASAALPSSFVVATYTSCTPHSSGFRAPCISAFLSNLRKTVFQ